MVAERWMVRRSLALAVFVTSDFAASALTMRSWLAADLFRIGETAEGDGAGKDDDGESREPAELSRRLHRRGAACAADEWQPSEETPAVLRNRCAFWLTCVAGSYRSLAELIKRRIRDDEGCGAVHLGEIGQDSVTVPNLEEARRSMGRAGMKFLFDARRMAFFQCGTVRLLIGVQNRERRSRRPGWTERSCTTGGGYSGCHAALREKNVEFVQEPHLVARMKSHDLCWRS